MCPCVSTVQRPGELSSDSEDEKWPPVPPKTNGTAAADKEHTNGAQEPEQERPNGAPESDKTDKADKADKADTAAAGEETAAPVTGQSCPRWRLRYAGTAAEPETVL